MKQSGETQGYWTVSQMGPKCGVLLGKEFELPSLKSDSERQTARGEDPVTGTAMVTMELPG